MTTIPQDAPHTQALVPWFRDDAEAFAFVHNRSVPSSLELSIEDALGVLGLGAPTKSGQIVGTESALRIAAAYACRRVISEDVAKLPVRVVKLDTVGARPKAEIQRDHAVHKLLNSAPNDWMTPFELLEYMVGVATFHHGSYALVQRTDGGHVDEILPLLPASCQPETDAFWRVTYRTNGYGQNYILQPDQVFRINGHMSDPWRGQSTISLAREAVGLAAAIEASQARFHGNDLRPSGVLTTSAALKPESRDAIRADWQRAYGINGTGGVAILDSGFDFKSLTAEGAKSEVIENRKFQISEICRFFRVFPVAIGHNDGSQSFASVEAFFTAHAQHTLQPWVKRCEQAMTLCLLTEDERRQGLKVDIDMDAILRGTPSDEAKLIESAVKTHMTPNEARIRRGMAPIEGDPDMDRVQLQRNNTGTLATPIAPAAATPAAPAALPAGESIL